MIAGNPRQTCYQNKLIDHGWGCLMFSQRSIQRHLLLMLSVGLLFFAHSGPVAVAQVFSVDPASPLAAAPGGSPANLYMPGPVLYCPAGNIGLLAADDIDAFSFGFDDVTSPTVLFSTGSFTAGAVVGGNAVCSEAGTCPPAVPCAPEASADIFSTLGGGTAALRFDGDGVPGAAPPLGLTECPAGGPGIQDNVDAFDDLVAPLVGGSPAWPVYFSLAPGSPTLAGANPLLPGGAGPADILVYEPGQQSLSVFFAAAGLGLVPGDDIDGLSFDVLTSDLLFSLAPSSPSLAPAAGICPGGCTSGDFILSAGPICGPTPCLAGGLGFASAGLAPGDNVDAMDQPGSPPALAFDDISPGVTYSLDPSSPLLAAIRTAKPVRDGSPADLLTQDRKNPRGAPIVVYRAESLGLVPDDDIDGLSFGLESVFVPGGDYAVEFSVDRAATGAPGTGVLAETTAPTGAEASPDIFDSFMPAAAGSGFIGTNHQTWDGNGSSAPTLQLRDVPRDLHANDNLDASEGPPRIADPDGDGVRDLPVYFSLAPGSPTLAAIGATESDILVCPAPTCASPTIFISYTGLGIAAGDNLEDFSLDAAVGNAAMANVDFTLPPVNSLGAAPGAILKRVGFSPCVAAACTVFSPAAVGLLSGDNMNALDSLDPVQVCVSIASIAPGADPEIDVAHGACPLLAASAGPYDVIEGELGELTERVGNVDLSRVFCRADDWILDKITLEGGIDPFTRPRFILVRNAGTQSDYGTSTLGNPRNPADGGCP